MARIAIVADTDVPARAEEIPSWVLEEIREADRATRADDFDSMRVYERIREHADGELTSVSGNVDPEELECPSVATLADEGSTFVVSRGTGSPDGWH